MKLNLGLLATLTLTGALAASAATLKYDGAGSNSYNGVPTYPYKISVNGGADILMMCDDYATHLPSGTWSANAYSLTLANVSHFKFSSEFANTAAAYFAYEEAAVLFADAQTHSANAAADNAAVWFLFTPNPPNSGGISDPGGALAALIASAGAKVNAGGLNFTGITIYTPTPNCAAQEFLAGALTSNNSPVPEPGTFALFGAGLVGLGVFSRRLRRS